MAAILQSEAEQFIAAVKRPASGKAVTFPRPGQLLEIDLASDVVTGNFVIHVNRKMKQFDRYSIALRYRTTITLIRLDVGGGPHQNPDKTKVPAPHLHWYSEKYGDRVAYAVPTARFQDLTDPYQTLVDFFTLCNVVEQPEVQGVMNLP
ncbi:hypothetical protein BH23CHL1_BH23CHL1_11520 [soil metagenome]|jgi:hypothetical protein